MGINQSSACHAASSCAVIPTSYSLSLAGAYTGSMKDGSVMEPCAAAKVLLLDGRVLHFTSKVRVAQVLAGFPHHCLCPLDSASLSTSNDSITTFFKPVSLNPDDLVRPPCVYILLPRRTFRLFAAAAATAMRNNGHGGRTHRSSGSRVCDSEAYSCTCSATSSKQCHTADACSQVCNTKACASMGATNSSKLPCKIRSCPSLGAHGGSRVGDTIVASDTTVCGTVAAHHHRTTNQTRRIPLQPYHTHANSHSQLVQPSLPNSHQQLVRVPSTSSSLDLHPHRRSLDLRHASSSQHRRPPVGMRRCRSWRPRLQAINEVHVYS